MVKKNSIDKIYDALEDKDFYEGIQIKDLDISPQQYILEETKERMKEEEILSFELPNRR
jgi:hypothetical protein